MCILEVPFFSCVGAQLRPGFLHHCRLFGLRLDHLLPTDPGLDLYILVPADLAWHRHRHWIVRRHRTDQADKTLVVAH